MNLKNLIIVMSIGIVWAQSDSPLTDTVNNLPPELRDRVDANKVGEVANKTIATFKSKCEKNAGPNAFNKSQTAVQQLRQCVDMLVDTEKLKQEIEDAKPTGQVDEVFKKYCQKTPQFKKCFRDFTDTVRPCFSVEEQKPLDTVYSVLEQLAEFVCFKEGDRIALFIAESGPQCFQEKQAEIEMCANATTDMPFNNGDISLENIPKVTFGEKECRKLGELKVCVVSALETCSVSTSANIVDSLLKFALKATPCKEMPDVEVTKAARAPNSASGLALRSLAMLFTVLALLV